nr:hypothetical protein [Enemella dayhoffiae]
MNGPVGVPTGPETCGLRDGGCMRHFTGGSIYSSNSTNAQLVKGAVRDKWARMGWETGKLGYPTSDEICGLRDGGCVQFFRGGSMYWSPGTDAHPVWGAIGQAYGKVKSETSTLGYPTGDELCGLRDGGCTQRFSGGLISWSPATGAHPIWGAIYQRYAALGWETSQLGYPTGSEFCGLRDGGCGQFFQGGAIYWSPRTDARPVWGAIQQHWARNGWEAGRYGYPVFGETCGTVNGVRECRQDFQGGTIVWNAVRGTF